MRTLSIPRVRGTAIESRSAVRVGGVVAHHRPLAEVAPVVDMLAGDAFFVTSEFANLWRSQGGRPTAWTVEDQGRVLAAVPGVEFGQGPFTRFFSMPDGCYGGMVREDCDAADERRWGRALLDAIVARRYARTHLFDFENRLPDDDRFALRDQTTTIVDIDPEWVPADRKLQSQIRAALRRGIQVEEFDWDRHGLRFLDLMRRTEARHGQKPHLDPHFFERLARLAQNPSPVHWVWCEHEGQAVCTHIYCHERDMLQGWQIYFDKAFSFLKPNQYMRFTTCRRFARKGVRRLNLGATPDGANGLAYYKRRWGGRPRRYRWFGLAQGVGRFRRQLRRALGRG